MIKVLFVIHDLSVGGAEKVLVNLVNNMDYKKFDITVLALFDEGVNKQFLNRNVKYRYVFKKAIKGNSHLLKLLSPRLLYKCLIPKGADVIVSYLEGPVARIISGAKEDDTYIVSWIHCTMHSQNELSIGFRNYKEALSVYRKFDAMAFVSKEVEEAFRKVCKVSCKTYVLYNTNDSNKIIKESQQCIVDPRWNKEEKVFRWCGVGKIVKNKAFDRMVRIQKRLIEEGYKTHLYILGTGDQEERIKQWCKNNRINNNVTFLGYQINPYQFIANCDLYVCASYSEGFSTATTEALILGTPVCTVKVSGMKEMLEDGKYGLITDNDEEALYQGIKMLLNEPDLLQYYRKQAEIRGKDFSTKKTVHAVEEMLQAMALERK